MTKKTTAKATTIDDATTKHLKVGRKKINKATRSLRECNSTLCFVSAFSAFFIAFCYLIRWVISNIRNVDLNSVSLIIGMFITFIMSIVTGILFGGYIFIQWLLRLSLWKVVKGSLKLGFIALICFILWNWKDSSTLIIGPEGVIKDVHTTQGVGTRLQSAINTVSKSIESGSDASKKLALKAELQHLKEGLEKVGTLHEGDDFEWAFLDTPSLDLLEAQMDLKSVSFDSFRRGLEEVLFRCSLLWELSKTATPTRETFDAALKKADSKEFQKANEDRLRLRNRIDIIVTRLEVQSLSNHLAW